MAAVALWSLTATVLGGCTGSVHHTEAVPSPAQASAATTPTAGLTTATSGSSRSATTVTAPLVAWPGPVEHLFFHTLVINPGLAFARDKVGQGFRDYFVTVGEFKAILAQLYASGWTLVDIHRVIGGTVRVPAGRRPMVISEDDVNYYEYEHTRGLGWRLAPDSAGAVKVEVHDRADRVARASAIADRLKATGWVLASHSYGHIDLSATSPAYAERDTGHWLAEDEPITGPTDVYIYPFGARPPPATIATLKAAGFTILCDIDVTPRLLRVDGVAVMSRRHIDGVALRQQAAQLKPFFDTHTVADRAARGT